jgi:outer membrane protein assembly factor BamD (BamD/ComL family)
MASKGSRLCMTLLCGLGFLGGCALVPPPPPGAHANAKSDNDEYDGWLWNSLRGRHAKAETTSAVATPPAPSANATSPVTQASATLPVGETGPLIAGPSSELGRLRDSAAGPPPSIPAELPAPSADAVSISKAKMEEEKKKGFELADLAPENIYKNVKKAAGYGPDEKIARAAKKEGEELYEAKKYAEAAAKFGTAADRWPDSPLEEDALFLKGESEFFADKYPAAHDTFGGLLKKYSNTRHLDTVSKREFAIGHYWEQLQDSNPKWPVTPNVTDQTRPLFDSFGYAVQAYERIRMNDPTGPLADDSLMALGGAYFRRGRFEDAAYNYDLLMKEYPNSEFQTQAHILALQAKMRVYQGSTYDITALKDAKKIADRALTQFGNKLGAEQERVVQARAQIIEELANRDLVLAQYYDNHGYYDAARIYYESVIKDYPSTEKARVAKARLEEIRGKPAVPANRFAWLTGIFESEKQVR